MAEKIPMEDGNDHRFVFLSIDDESWYRYVHSHPSATIFHHPAWTQLISDCYGYKAYVCALTDKNYHIQAGAPFIDFDSWLTGHRWISLPYTDFCQPLAKNDIALREFVERLIDRYKSQNISGIELRWGLPQSTDIYSTSEFVLHSLDLTPGLDILFKKLRKDHRHDLRKVDSSPIKVIKAENRFQFDRFYQLHVHTRKRLGVPVQPRRFFDLLWDNIIQKDLGFVLLGYQDNQPIAGAIFLTYNDTVIYKYSASNESSWKFSPNKLILWHAMKISHDNGFKVFHFGNSPTDNKGLREFKQGWGSVETDLVHSYIGKAPANKRGTSGSNVGTFLFRHSPSFVCRIAGELLYQHFC